MLIVTAKLPRRNLALGVAAAALACCAVLALNLTGGTAWEASASTVPNHKNVRTNEDRVAYLEAYGWEVSPDPIATQELQIPEELDESFQEYLSLQEQQGFDLSDYTGKRVKRYTYEVTNYPTGEQGIQANLLLHKNTVIGGEVLSPRLDGFLHGLAMP